MLRRLARSALLVVSCWTHTHGIAAAEPVSVYAAASLKDALETVLSDTAPETVLVLAGSGTLARQIANGAPADIFVSANGDWMDDLARRALIDPSRRVDLVGNRLVVIAPAAPGLPDTLTVAEALATGRIATGFTDAVPAGIYAKAALEHLGLWPEAAPRIVPSDSVRGALALVAAGAVPRGIVYATDAIAEPRVQILATIPPDSHPPIVYPMAPIAGRDTPGTQAVLDALQGAEAHAVYARHGFIPTDQTR